MAMVLMVSASGGSMRVVLSDMDGGAVESTSGRGEREGTEVEGLQWQTYSFLSVSSLTPGKMGTTTMYHDLTNLYWNMSEVGKGLTRRVFQKPLKKEIKCWLFYEKRSQCVEMLPENATSHVGVPVEERGVHWPAGLTLDISPGYFGQPRSLQEIRTIMTHLRLWTTPGTLFIFGLRDPISAYASRFMFLNKIRDNEPSHLGPSASQNIEGFLGMELECETERAELGLLDLAPIAVAAYARKKGIVDEVVLLATQACITYVDSSCDPHLKKRHQTWGMYTHNYVLTTYLIQGMLGDLASADNVLVYQMEAWGRAREAFVQRMIVMLFGTAFAESHPFYITDGDKIKNQGKEDPMKAEYGTLSATSKCRLAQQLQYSATEMVHMVHDLEARGVVQTFLPDDFVYGVQPDWWGGLEAKYCTPST